MSDMRLNSIFAECHILDGEVNGKPIRLLLKFDGNRSLRLQVAGDGWRMIVDDGPLDAPCDIGSEFGRFEVSDLTESLFPMARGLHVQEIEELALHGMPVGMRLNGAGDERLNFWVDGDELHWGDEAELASHHWLDGVPPTVMGRFAI